MPFSSSSSSSSSQPVHFSKLNLLGGVEVERAHLLSDIIRNIEEDPRDNYYERIALSYAVKQNDRVFAAIYGQSTCGY